MPVHEQYDLTDSVTICTTDNVTICTEGLEIFIVYFCHFILDMNGPFLFSLCLIMYFILT